MSVVAERFTTDKTPEGDDRRPRERFLQPGRPAQPPAPHTTHDGLLRDILSAEQLTALFAPLARDYRAAIVLSAGLGFRDRSRALRCRLDAYTEGLGAALDQAKDEATALLRGPRSWWRR